jgi:peptidoglycan/LPS O-acetylase OafA/YrhL
MLMAARPLGWFRYVLWVGLLGVVAALYDSGADWASNVQFWRALPAFFFGLCLRLDWQALSALKIPGWISVVLALLLTAGSLLNWPGAILLGLAYGAAVGAILADGRGQVSALTRRLAPLGQLTYSMYMLHPIIILVLVNALGDKLLKLEPLPLGLLTLASYGVIYLASLISFKLFETPARQWIDGLKLVAGQSRKGVSPGV